MELKRVIELSNVWNHICTHIYIYKEAYLWGGKGLSLHQFFRSTIFFAPPPPFATPPSLPLYNDYWDIIYHYNFILINELKKG